MVTAQLGSAGLLGMVTWPPGGLRTLKVFTRSFGVGRFSVGTLLGALSAHPAIGSPFAPPALPSCLPSPALTQKNVLRAAEPGEFVSQPAPDEIRNNSLLDNSPLGLVIDFLPSYPQLCPALPVSAGLFILMLGLLIA